MDQLTERRRSHHKQDSKLALTADTQNKNYRCCARVIMIRMPRSRKQSMGFRPGAKSRKRNAESVVPSDKQTVVPAVAPRDYTCYPVQLYCTIARPRACYSPTTPVGNTGGV